MSYDDFHENGDRIYRINQTFIWGEDNPNPFASTGPGVGYSISQEIPEAEQVVRVHTPELNPVRFKLNDEEKFFNDEYILAADTNFYEVFSFPLLYGDSSTVLDKPNSIVLSEDLAIKYFGNENPVGQLIDLGGGPLRETFRVTGVAKKIDNHSYIDYDMMISMNTIDRVARSDWSWMWTTFETFILLDEQANPEVVRSKLNQLPEKHAIKTLKVMGYTYEEYIAAGKEWNLFLQPFEDIYLHSSNIYNRLNDVGNIKIVAALIGSAIFLLILSCINFINLSTSQFTNKAQNVAVRKILGGDRRVFLQRFFGESLAYCIVACVVSIFLILNLLPLINQFTGTELSLSILEQPLIVLFISILILIVSAIAGFYPFLFFNSFGPISALKGELRSGKKGLGIRNGMLVTQYVLSFLLIICTITIYKQLNHITNADLGFSKDNLIVIENTHWTGSQDEFADELAKIDGVKNTTVCDALPFMVYNGDQFIPDKPEAGSLPLNYVLGDDNYMDLLEIEMVVGRKFNSSYSDDKNGIIINETAARTIGWSIDKEILNQKITNWSGTYHIIGVAKDFNFLSLHSPIEPFAIFHSESNAQGKRPLYRVVLKSDASQDELNDLIAEVNAKWDEFASGRPFEYLLLEDHFESIYRNEKQFGSVLSFFAVLTIIIASLGLFGIVVFSVEQKLKEIGVRKVLGASISSIVLLFSKNYIKLLLIGFAIAVPAAYYFMNNWLSDFEYHISMGIDIYILSLGILLFISLAIAIFQTTKASLMNPSEVLKDE